jgi:hypothetical protein
MNTTTNVTRIICCLLLALGCILNAHTAAAETCICDSPCSGSRTCPDGCWAFCEERQSGPYCAKGCVYDVTDMKAAVVLNKDGRVNAIDIKVPTDQVRPLLERLFGVKLKEEASPSASERVALALKNVTLTDIIGALKKDGFAFQVVKPSGKLAAEAIKSVVLTIGNDKGLASRIASTLPAENCSFVCYEWDCQPNPLGTVHCECKRGEVVCSKGK